MLKAFPCLYLVLLKIPSNWALYTYNSCISTLFTYFPLKLSTMLHFHPISSMNSVFSCVEPACTFLQANLRVAPASTFLQAIFLREVAPAY